VSALHLNRFHNISLKWKLLIPFLSLASMGAIALFLVSYRFQAHLIHLNEEKRLTAKYHYFLDAIDLKKEQVLSLASMAAKNPAVAKALATRDRKALMDILEPGFQELKGTHGIEQLHFHVPPATSFLRVHLPDRYGDDLGAYRQTITEAMGTGREVGGLEWGQTGFSLRGVVPIWYDRDRVGTVEIGWVFDETFLEHFRSSLDADLSLYVPGEPLDNGPMVFASTIAEHVLPLALFNQVFSTEEPVFHTANWEGRDVAAIVGPVYDFSFRTAAVVEISVDRSRTLALLKEYRTSAIIIGLVGLVLSTSFVWLISMVFTKRIAKVVEASEEIAAGHRDRRITVKGSDEIGTMAGSINKMLGSLEASRRKVKVYADNLEVMVEQRTRALRESEQSYRTLVEHVPVIVYFVMADGTAIFLNRFVEEVIGVSPQELRGHHEVWAEYVHPHDRRRILTSFQECLRQGKAFHTEYRMIHKDGHAVYVLDHAVPVFDNNNQLVRMDGIILDVTARKELQEKIVQAEELEMLSDVSARLAHEIRNPLTSIGGLTRRLVKSFDASDSRRKKGKLIVEEVGKLEKILQMMTAYIEPKAITLRPCDLNDVVENAVKTMESQHKKKGFSITLRLHGTLGKVNLDSSLFEKIMVSLMENAFYRMNQTGAMEIVTDRNGGYAVVSLAYETPFISDDDIDHFFYPFVVDYPFPERDSPKHVMDIPICKVLIHKHGGIINVDKGKANTVKVTISLPYEEQNT
jgi:PAS domain S-box-containing protein